MRREYAVCNEWKTDIATGNFPLNEEVRGCSLLCCSRSLCSPCPLQPWTPPQKRGATQELVRKRMSSGALPRLLRGQKTKWRCSGVIPLPNMGTTHPRSTKLLKQAQADWLNYRNRWCDVVGRDN